MHNLIITATPPPIPGWDEHGIYRRLAMFVRALGGLGKPLRMLHFVPPTFMATHADRAALGATLSEHWRTPVDIALIPIAQRRETVWNHYVAGGLWAGHQPTFCRFTGPRQVGAVRAALAEKPEVVLVHRLTAMHPVIASAVRPPRLFFDLDDVEHRVAIRRFRQPPFWPAKLAYLLHAAALVRSERTAAAHAAGTFVCSEHDALILRRWGVRAPVHVVPNAVAMPACAQAVLSPRSLLHLGDYSYGPNKESADRLIQRIWPRVRARCQDATLLIAGRHAELLESYEQRDRLSRDGVTFTGFVASLPDLYGGTRAVACPLIVGGGTRFKLIEAASYAKPMVATSVGGEGLQFAREAEILLRDDDESFAAACATVLTDDEACRRLGAAAQAKARALYEQSAIERRVSGIMSGVPA